MTTLLQNALIHGKLCLCIAMVAIAVVPTLAQEPQLTLLGHRWERPTVTYRITAAREVSAQAVADVKTALADWNSALGILATAGLNVPTLVEAGKRDKPDLVVDLRVKETRRVFGGDPLELGGDLGVQTTSGCVLDSVKIGVQGTSLGGNSANARVRNLTRHLLGEALGLGHVACPQGPTDCTGDLMKQSHNGSAYPETDLAISDCDLLGIAAIYGAPSCDQIPASVPYVCD